MKRRTGALSNDVTEKSNQNTTWVNSIKRSKDAGVLSKDGIFSGITACILPVGMGKTRLNVFKTIIVNNGGQLLNTYSSVVTHVIADDCVTAECLQTLIEKNSISKDENYPLYVRTKWLSDCIKMKERLDAEDYIFKFPAKAVCKETVQSIQKDTSDTSGGLVFSSNENKASISQNDVCMSTKLIAPNDDKVPGLLDSHSQSNGSNINKSAFACSVSSGNQKINYNKHITDKLEVLATTFKSLKDQWRAVGYERAISVLKNHPKEITTWEEARSLRGVGERLADKIWEIVQSGGLRKMDEVCSGEKTTALNLFMDIWGVGPSTAQQLVQQGFRTLDDLKKDDNVLNRQQKIGLKYYEEFLERIPREEAAEIELTVKNAAINLQPDMIAIACGSYRRGKSTCGDVDVLVTHKDGKSHIDFLRLLVAALHQSGFLTDDLVSQEISGEQQKYLGVCKLPGPNSKHRRLDIIVVPYSEYACAMLYFTGSAHFNRSMRLLASKINMSLSEHSLNAGVVRTKGQEKVCGGYPLPTPTEESVFDHLGIPYRPPEERDH